MNSLKPLLKIFRKRHTLPLLLIIASVIVANSINVFNGNADPNPVLQRSGLATVTKTTKTLGYNTIDPNDGFVSQALGYSAAESWLHGHIPWWNYYEGIGAPLAGEMQSAALFPPILLLHFSNGLLYMHILLEVTAGIATYFFLRRLGLAYIVATTFGIAFALNGTFSWLANSVVNPIAFLPLLLLGIEIAYDSAQKRKKWGWTLIAIAIALSLYSGFPETAFIDGLFAMAWGLIRTLQLSKSFRADYIKKLASGAIVGVLLAAPILVAFADYLPHALTGGHAGAFAHASLTRIGISSLFMPYIFGPIFAFNGYSTNDQLLLLWSNVGGYVIASSLVLAFIGAFNAKQSKAIRVFLGVAIILCLGRIFGVSVFVSMVNLIPGIKSTAFYRYAYPAVEFAFIILAAFGFDAIIKQNVAKVRIVLASCTAIIVLAALTLYARPELHTLGLAPGHHRWALRSVALASAAVIAVGIAGLLRRAYKTTAMAIIAAVIIGESFVLFIIPQLSTPKVLSFDNRPVSFLRQNLGTNRFYTLGPIEPNYGTYYSIASINQNDLPVPKDWSSYIAKNLDNNVDPLVFTGFSRKNPQGPTSLQEFFDHLSSYEDTGAKYLVANHGTLTSVAARQHGLTVAYSDKAIDIYQLPSTAAYFETSGASCNITAQSLAQATVNCSASAALVRRELYIPGWKASANGKSLSLNTYQTIYQSVALPKGTSKVDFTFLPPHMYIAGVMFIGGLGWLAYPLIQRQKPRSGKKVKV